MRNPGYEADLVFKEIEYKNRFVAFVDVMGVKNYMREANDLNELKLFSQLMHMYANQLFAYGKVNVTMFSDCMYLVAEEQYVDQLICLLANFAYNLLVNRESHVVVDLDGSIQSSITWRCLKLRGGITYGKVISLDEEAQRKNIPYSFNMVLGPVALDAYKLECTKAEYPRIIVDDAFLKCCTEKSVSLERYYLSRDIETDYYYLDFWSYMFKGKCGPKDFLEGCIEYTKKELKEAKEKRNPKLVGQIYWYLDYLERHLMDK